MALIGSRVSAMIASTAILMGLLTRVSAVLMPNGWDISQECVHHISSNGRVESLPDGLGDIVTDTDPSDKQQRVIHLPPCPHKKARRPSNPALGYYSDWIVDTVSLHESVGSMISNWTVPKVPRSRGPLPGMSSIYFFNGLEDNGGHGNASMILQPVLSYGRSGCVLNPLAGWKFTAFQVTAAGRAYCGPSVSVEEGDHLQGRMELIDKSKWRITADAGSKGRSEHVVTADFKATAAYLTLEGMVIYSCSALPSSESISFTDNSLTDSAGRALTPQWHTEIRHAECKPSVEPNGNAVKFIWNTAAGSDKGVSVLV